MHVFGALENSGRGRTECRFEQSAIGDALLQCVSQCARLLVNFLQHEMPVLALLGGISGQLTFANDALDGIAFAIQNLDGRPMHVGHVAFLEKNEAPRYRQ